MTKKLSGWRDLRKIKAIHENRQETEKPRENPIGWIGLSHYLSDIFIIALMVALFLFSIGLVVLAIVEDYRAVQQRYFARLAAAGLPALNILFRGGFFQGTTPAPQRGGNGFRASTNTGAIVR